MKDLLDRKVIASIVARGDLSCLNSADRADHYVRMCEGLGLNPHAQPFAYIKLGGKEVLYATRIATDQLAKNHNLDRVIIDGPKVIDVGGTKMAYALCRATLPSGRVETATATTPLRDPVNALMTVETKAKRRATLAILGLGLLDEMELETIPDSAKRAGPKVQLPLLEREPVGPCGPRDPGDDEDMAPDTRGAAKPLVEIPEVVADFRERLEEIELPGEAVAVWMRYRADIAKLDERWRQWAWTALCATTERVGKMKNTKVWLKKCIAEEEARRVYNSNSFGSAS